MPLSNELCAEVINVASYDPDERNSDGQYSQDWAENLRRLFIWGSAAVAIMLRSNSALPLAPPQPLAITRVTEIRAKMLQHNGNASEAGPPGIEKVQYYPWGNWQNWPNYYGWVPSVSRLWRWPRH